MLHKLHTKKPQSQSKWGLTNYRWRTVTINTPTSPPIPRSLYVHIVILWLSTSIVCPPPLQHSLHLTFHPPFHTLTHNRSTIDRFSSRLTYALENRFSSKCEISLNQYLPLKYIYQYIYICINILISRLRIEPKYFSIHRVTVCRSMSHGLVIWSEIQLVAHFFGY